MWKTAAVTALFMTILSVNTVAEEARTIVEDASRAMGATGLSSITYSGSAAIGNFGQSRTISFGLASTAIRNYTRTIDFTQPASVATGDIVPPFNETITPSSTAWAQQLQIWVTPWGFLRGAAAHHSFAVYYIETDTIEVEGNIVEFQYQNPHSGIHIVGQEAFGRPKAYAAEWANPSRLERDGITRNTLHVGDSVRIWASPSRDPNDNRIRLKRIERRSDGWHWG
jgi:hypothetical protein